MSSQESRIRFFKTTLIGGLVFLVPVVVLIIILTKAVGLMMAVAEPMAGLFPVDSIGGLVLATFGAASRIGLEIERLDDGRVVVLVPSSPNPWSGPVHIMAPDDVRRLDLTMPNYIEIIERFGQGMNQLLNAKKDGAQA